MLLQFLSWYLVSLLILLLSLPLAGRVFANLLDRGYAFARQLGILLTGVLFWLGYSYGLLRNESGGAWLSLIGFALISLLASRQLTINNQRSTVNGQQSLLSNLFPSGRYVLVVELLFLLVFAGWAIVRSHDPAVDHTEEPMDLMFMNSLWHSPTFPPHDAWLSGYAVSYYYLGYWLVTMIGRLSGQPPEIAYNLGQASWYALLAIGCFGIVYNLLEMRNTAADKEPDDPENRKSKIENPKPSSLIGGLLASITVAFAGNMQGILEWLYANGYNITRLANWLAVKDFPANAKVTNQWYIAMGEWWWWRTARVLADVGLDGGHREVIDETPIFSYLLGDMHPHVLGMPFMVLAIALALSLFTIYDLRFTIVGTDDAQSKIENRKSKILPPWPYLLLLIIAVGAALFFNTWDFPPYWLLALLCWFAVLWHGNSLAPDEQRASFLQIVGYVALFGLVLIVGSLLLYLPYFLTAQSQAGGFWPNLFHPTRFTQFMVMFLPQLLAMIALLLVMLPRWRPSLGKIITSGALVFGIPVSFLLLCALNIARTQPATANGMGLPAAATSFISIMIERWSAEPWTLLLLTALLTCMAALVWQFISQSSFPAGAELENRKSKIQNPKSDLFVLFLAGIGLLMLLLPEVVYLRDNFGWRMNTIFKFYYQGWLLLGLASAYAVVSAFRANLAARLIGTISLLLILAALIVPLAGVYSRTNGFGNPNPTFDSSAYVGSFSPAELAAVQWVHANTPSGALILEVNGGSYRSDSNRISYMTGRQTLLGWDGHEGQWRGARYGEMANGRTEALAQIYVFAPPDALPALLTQWNISYVYVGPAERGKVFRDPISGQERQMNAADEDRLLAVMDVVFEQEGVRIYRRR